MCEFYLVEEDDRLRFISLVNSFILNGWILDRTYATTANEWGQVKHFAAMHKEKDFASPGTMRSEAE